jgi:hypothetical protein
VVGFAVAVGFVVAVAVAVGFAVVVAVAVAVATIGRIRVFTCAGTCIAATAPTVTVASHVTNTAYHPMGLGIPLVSATSYASTAVTCCGRPATDSGGAILGTGTTMNGAPSRACILSKCVA